jgi:hypothetical protein
MPEAYSWRAGLGFGEFVIGDGTLICDLRGIVRRAELEALVDGIKECLAGETIEGVLLDFSLCGLACTTSTLLRTLEPFHAVPLVVVGTVEQSNLLDAYAKAARFIDVRHAHLLDLNSAVEWLGVMALNNAKIAL